mmetsp:Transcript_9335/g.9178  ORF Transcript_9335/g.9178 Transcript_9335/m.9178 type:complete len:95 (+) Transcript_9335:44-328(+)
MTHGTSPGTGDLQQHHDQHQKQTCSKNCRGYASSNTSTPPATEGCCIPQWLGHPRKLKSYAVFEPFPEMEYRKVQKLASAIHGKVYLYEHIPTR